ncbi:MAG: hypothetical protein MUO40_10350 [Anaerolineaceae bacterium]|nr:hypothetical protein [Anaerolineaceae bacterium]
MRLEGTFWLTIFVKVQEYTERMLQYFESTGISLGSGIYPYTWTGLDGYIGSGEGGATIFSCVPKILNEVDVSIGACIWTEPTGSH